MSIFDNVDWDNVDYVKLFKEFKKEYNENTWNNPDWFPQLYGLDKELTKAYDERERKRKAGEPWKI